MLWNSQSKPLTIKQHALHSMLEGSRSPSPSAPITYAKEQAVLKDETIRAFKNAVPSDDSDSEDDLLVPREKTKDELELEDEEYREFLQREVGMEIDLKELITVENDTVGLRHDEKDGTVNVKKKEKKKRKDKSAKEKRSEETDQDFLVKYGTLVTLCLCIADSAL
jgi:protein KRI1